MTAKTKNLLIILAFLSPLIVSALLLAAVSFIHLPGPEAGAKKYRQAGDRAYEQKRYTNAVNYYTKAISLCPQDPSPYLSRARSYLNQEHYTQGARDLAKAIKLDPDGAVGRDAYAGLKSMRDALVEQKNSVLKDIGINLSSEWEKSFNEATPYISRRDYVSARNLHLQALAQITAAKNAYHDNINYYGCLYATKGYMYFISGSNYLNSVKSGMDDYDALVLMRKSYYPLKCAQYYYDAAREHFTTDSGKKMTQGLIKMNDYYINNSAEKFLPGIDYGGRAFISTTDKEAKVTVNFDLINDKLAVKDFKSAAGLINENSKLINTMYANESVNGPGFVDMNNAYTRLYRALYNMNEDPVKNRDIIRSEIDACLADLARARAEFRNRALADAAAELESYVTEVAKNAG